MKKYHFMDPELIMTIVISLIILGVGTFAFFITVQNMPNALSVGFKAPSATTSTAENQSYYAWENNTKGNASDTAVQVFNIVGVVLIIGAIMTIVGIVYSYVRPGGY